MSLLSKSKRGGCDQRETTRFFTNIKQGLWDNSSSEIQRRSLSSQLTLAIAIVAWLMVLWATPICANTALYPFSDPKQSAQFQHVLSDLRCPVCQNQDLADSNAAIAKDLRQQVYRLVLVGKSDDEIGAYLAARYGDFILFKPPIKAITCVLWFGPGLLIMAGLIVFYLTCVNRKKNG